MKGLKGERQGGESGAFTSPENLESSKHGGTRKHGFAKLLELNVVSCDFFSNMKI